MKAFIKCNTEIEPIKRLDFNYWSPRENYKNTDNYETRRLVEWVRDNSITTSAFYPSITPFYRKKDEVPGLIPFIRVNDARKLLLEYDDTVFLDRDILSKLSKNIKIVRPKDIVITKGGEYIGEASLVPDCYDEYAICRDILAIHTNKCEFSGAYLCSYFQSEIGKRELIRTKSVQGQPHLTIEKVQQIEIPYFGNDFEDEINAYWNSFYALIAASDAHLDNAVEMLDSFLLGLLQSRNQLLVFTRELTDKDICLRIDVEYYQQAWSNLVNALKSKGIKFVQAKLKKQAIDKSDPRTIYNYIRLADIDYRSGIIKRFRELPAHALPDRAKRAVIYKDILVSSLKGSKQKISIIEDDINNMVASTGFFVVTTDSLEPEVLYAIIRSYFYDLFIEQMASGAIMSSITERYFKLLEFPVIDTQTQKRIVPEIQNYLEKRSFAFDAIEQASQKFDEELLA